MVQIVKYVLNCRKLFISVLRLDCTKEINEIRRVMKFLKINAKVLLILCLFSGILFLSTGCGDKDKDPDATQTGASSEKETDSSEDEDNSTTEGNTSGGSNTTTNGTASTGTTDYTVWVANTTINTDKSQKSYKVIWGDTLWLISTAWEVPYMEIARFNNIKNPDLIYVDQIIYNPLYK